MLIKNIDRARQLNDFTGLLTGKLCPTDVDGLIEYKDKAYIFFELKYRSKELPTGQKIAYERMVNDTYKAGKISVAIVLEHEVTDTNENILVADTKVRSIYYCKDKRWREPKQSSNCKEFVDTFINFVDTH